MATIDLGKIKQVWRGTYNNSTAYTVDDVVSYTDSGITSSYICVANSTGNAPSSSGTAHASWNYLAKGVADPIPSQSGQSGKYLTTNGSALSFATVGQGKIIDIKTVRHTTSASFNVGSTNLASANVFYFPNTSNALLELSYARTDAANAIILQGHYSVNTSSNFHACYAYVAEDTSIRKNLAFDEHNFSRTYGNLPFFCMFTAAELGSYTGSRTFTVAIGAGNSRTHTGVRCPNLHSAHGDTSNAPHYSELTLMEVVAS